MLRRPLLLTSLDNPRLKRIVRLRKQRERREEGVFIAEGLREVGRALEAGLALRELYYAPTMIGMDVDGLQHHLRALDRQDALVFEVTPPLYEKIAYIENPEGLLAVFDQPKWSLRSLPPPTAGQSELFLVAAGTNKPGNLGAMARTAAAAGVTALFAADAEVDPFNPNAIRASTGAVFTLPIFSLSIEATIDFLAARGVSILAATPDARMPYFEADLCQPLAVVIGAEDTGVDNRWREAADLKVTIPMKTGLVDSLNASNAAAILLFEAMRQRRSRGL